MGLKFFHLPSHRVFDYTPRYYDPQKEKLESGITQKNDQEYVPGSIVAKGFRKSAFRSGPRKQAGYTKGKRIIVYIIIALILVALFYLSLSFASLIEAFKAQKGM